jgi:hypothetical protein
MKEAVAQERLRELETMHRMLDDELRYLTRRAYLTPSEQQTARDLKKRKLSAKDELYALRRSLRSVD